jgi:hypothetical protein
LFNGGKKNVKKNGQPLPYPAAGAVGQVNLSAEKLVKKRNKYTIYRIRRNLQVILMQV